MGGVRATTSAEPARRALIAWAAVVLCIAAALHSGAMNAVIAWDEAHYILAARQGVAANAFELGELNAEYRHWHGPLMVYSISASSAVFGHDEWAARLPTVVIASLTSVMVLLALFDLARGHTRRRRLTAAVIAALLMATAPASVELAGVIQPHSFVIFFLVLNIWTLCRYVRDLHRRDAVLFGLSLAGQFLAMEYGPVVLCFALLAVALARPHLLGLQWRRPFIVRAGALPLPRVHGDIYLAAIICLAAVALLWPAGVFRGGAAMNFTYYLLYAAHGHPIWFRGELLDHLPRYAYAWWYAIDYPALLVGMLIGGGLIGAWAWRARTAVAIAMAAFTFGLIASVHAAHIMSLAKSVFMLPPLVMGAPLAGLWAIDHYASRRATCTPMRVAAARRPAVALVIIAACAILGGRITPLDRGADQNERLTAMCRAIADGAQPNERILAQGWPMVRYMLHLKHGRSDLVIDRYDPRNYHEDALQQKLDARRYDWAVTIAPTTKAHPDCPLLLQLHERWRIVVDASTMEGEYRVYHAPERASPRYAAPPSLARREDTGRGQP